MDETKGTTITVNLLSIILLLVTAAWVAYAVVVLIKGGSFLSLVAVVGGISFGGGVVYFASVARKGAAQKETPVTNSTNGTVSKSDIVDGLILGYAMSGPNTEEDLRRLVAELQRIETHLSESVSDQEECKSKLAKLIKDSQTG
jgi:hypothetical protein